MSTLLAFTSLLLACGTPTEVATEVPTDPLPVPTEFAPVEVAALDAELTDLALVSTPDERVWLAVVDAGDTLVRQFDVGTTLDAGQVFDLPSGPNETAAVAMVLEQGLIPTVLTVDSACRTASGPADRDLVAATDVSSCSTDAMVGGAVGLGGVNPFSGSVDVAPTFFVTEVPAAGGTDNPINRTIGPDASELARWFWNQPPRAWSQLHGTHGQLVSMESDNDLVWGIDGTGDDTGSNRLPLQTSAVGYAIAYASQDDYFLVETEQGSARVHAFTYAEGALSLSFDADSEVARIEGVPSNTTLRIATIDRGFAVVWHGTGTWDVRLYRVVLGGDVDLVGSATITGADQVDRVEVAASELPGGETAVTIAEASPTALTLRGVVLP